MARAQTLVRLAVKGVQSMLGHASAAMTLDPYGDALGDELDTVAVRMDAARADLVRTERGRGAVPRIDQHGQSLPDQEFCLWPREDSNLRHTV
jgi:hypothetical protein